MIDCKWPKLWTVKPEKTGITIGNWKFSSSHIKKVKKENKGVGQVKFNFVFKQMYLKYFNL